MHTYLFVLALSICIWQEPAGSQAVWGLPPTQGLVAEWGSELLNSLRTHRPWPAGQGGTSCPQGAGSQLPQPPISHLEERKISGHFDWRCSYRSHTQRKQSQEIHSFTDARMGMRSLIFVGLNYCSSVAKLCLTLCDPMDCSMPGLPVLHHLLEFTQAHVHWVGVVIQPSQPLLPPSPPAFNLSQHQGLFQWVGSSKQVA